jgi:hypothetical protein
MAEDGLISEKYPLCETPSAVYAERTRWNVRDSDGTLVLTWGTPTNGTAFTVEIAEELDKPCLVIDLAEEDGVQEAMGWIEVQAIRTLNVAGPRASKYAFIYDKATEFLGRLLGETT